MRRGLRTATLAALLAAAATSPASAKFVPGCANPADSALNQYCETLPTAKGSQEARPGAPALATPLPGGVTQAIARGQGSQEQAQPQGGRAQPKPVRVPRASRVSLRIEGTGTSGLPLWLILLLVAVALGLIAAAAVRWRRGPPSAASGDGPP